MTLAAGLAEGGAPLPTGAGARDVARGVGRTTLAVLAALAAVADGALGVDLVLGGRDRLIDVPGARVVGPDVRHLTGTRTVLDHAARAWLRRHPGKGAEVRRRYRMTPGARP